MIYRRRKATLVKIITIHDNRICPQAVECVNNLSSVFKFDARPWIDPNGVNIEDIMQTIRKCPSGAPSYSINGLENKNATKRDPIVTVSTNGLYLITGEIDLVGDNMLRAEGSSE
jgi:uncharacterized Fe-S cluster protein YjdI